MAATPLNGPQSRTPSSMQNRNAVCKRTGVIVHRSFERRSTCSRSCKVTEFGTNESLYTTSLNNTNLLLSRSVSEMSRWLVNRLQVGNIFAFDKKVPLFNALVWGLTPRMRPTQWVWAALGYIFIAESMVYALTRWARKPTVFSDKNHYRIATTGHNSVQGHSMSWFCYHSKARVHATSY